MPPASQRDDHAVLATALDHTWRWYELRHGQGIQVVNFFMLAVAVMSAGYVSALNARLYLAAGAVGILGMITSIVVFLVARRLSQVGRLAEEPLIALQDRLASSLNVDALRMMERHRSNKRPGWWARATYLYGIATVIAVLLNLAAALYAWLGH